LHVLRGEEKDPAAGKDNEEEEDEAPHLRRDDDDGGAQIRFETCALIVKNKLFFFFFFFFFSVFIGSLFFSFFFLRFVPRCCRHFISNPKPKKHPHQNSLFRFRTPALLFGSCFFCTSESSGSFESSFESSSSVVRVVRKKKGRFFYKSLSPFFLSTLYSKTLPLSFGSLFFVPVPARETLW